MKGTIPHSIQDIRRTPHRVRDTEEGSKQVTWFLNMRPNVSLQGVRKRMPFVHRTIIPPDGYPPPRYSWFVVTDERHHPFKFTFYNSVLSLSSRNICLSKLIRMRHLGWKLTYFMQFVTWICVMYNKKITSRAVPKKTNVPHQIPTWKCLENNSILEIGGVWGTPFFIYLFFNFRNNKW